MRIACKGVSRRTWDIESGSTKSKVTKIVVPRVLERRCLYTLASQRFDHSYTWQGYRLYRLLIIFVRLLTPHLIRPAIGSNANTISSPELWYHIITPVHYVLIDHKCLLRTMHTTDARLVVTDGFFYSSSGKGTYVKHLAVSTSTLLLQLVRCR